jgi:hypothetical protein
MWKISLPGCFSVFGRAAARPSSVPEREGLPAALLLRNYSMRRLNSQDLESFGKKSAQCAMIK